MDITELTVHELQEKLKNKELTITEITKANIELMQIRIRTFRNKCDSYNKGKVKY